MDKSEFLDRVMAAADLDSREQAARITEEFLGCLGERLPRTERENLAAQLPAGLKEPLLQPTEQERYRLEEFYNRINARTDLSFEAARSLSRVVMDVLRQAVSAGEWQDLQESLPHAFGELFGEEA